MSSLIRKHYGHSGGKLRPVLIVAPFRDSDVDPFWLRILPLPLCILIALLVSRHSIPTVTQPVTLIDTSRLTAKVSEPLSKPVILEPRPVQQRPSPPVTPPQPDQARQQVSSTRLQQSAQPSINRPGRPEPADFRGNRPRIARERTLPGLEQAGPAATRIRRAVTVDEPLPAKTGITRTRGAVASELPLAGERVAAVRRAPGTTEQSSEAGANPHFVRRNSRSSAYSDTAAYSDGGAPRIASTRKRIPSGGDGDGGTAASVGLVRGISLMSLDICASPREEEDSVKAVLSIVGSRESCRNEKGVFQFIATQRISSFNIIIYPAQGRIPTNRCEELRYAYSCLKNR